MNETTRGPARISRRNLLKAGGALAVGALPGPWTPGAAAQAAPLRLGFQVHRTGIGAVYGRWYERTTAAAVKFINEKGGIGGRPVEIVAEDDGTDPKRGAEVVEKLAVHHKVDLIFGTLFSHVVIASAPRAGELKIPYLVVSEGYHVASGGLNRYVFQPGITDVRAQITAVAGWILKNVGKKVTLIFPDYAFGHDHRDFFSRVATAQGGTVRALIPIPPTETSFTKYFPRVPADTEVLYHVMVGPGVLTFAREMGEHFGARRPQIFGFIDSVEGVDIGSPGLEFLEGTYFWEAFPRYASSSTPAHVRLYRERVGINDSGASVTDPKDGCMPRASRCAPAFIEASSTRLRVRAVVNPSRSSAVVFPVDAAIDPSRSKGSNVRVSPCAKIMRARGIQSVSSPWIRCPSTCLALHQPGSGSG